MQWQRKRMPCHLISKLNTGEGGEKKKRNKKGENEWTETSPNSNAKKKKNYLFNYFRFSI